MSKPDVIIVGGGIIGCSLAEELARRRQQVVVVERGQAGSEASSAAAGILSAQTDLPQPGPLFGLCQASRTLYPQWVARLERRSGVRAGYQADGLLYLAMSRREECRMARQVRWQQRRGLRVERWSAPEVRRHEPAADGRFVSGFHFPDEAQVDSARLMRALARACRNAGVELREQTAARRLLIRGRTIRGVETARGTIRAPVVVNCLGSWAAMGGTCPVAMPVEPARGQLLAFRAPRRLFRHAIMSAHAYMVQRNDGRLIVGSTIERAGFTKALTVEGIHAILSGIRRMSRALDRSAFLEAWAGLRPSTPDGLPILGATSLEGLYIATGHFRHGILLAPVTARLMAELLLTGRSSFDLSPFAPQRFPGWQ